jgi:DNA primase
MSNRKEIVAEVKARTDCRALAEELGLRRRHNSFLCPFHPDHNPSLSVWRDGFKCWACGAKGDGLALYCGVRQAGFAEALNYLARRAGVVLPPRGQGQRWTFRRPPRPPAPQPPTGPTEPTPAISPERRAEIYTAVARAASLREGAPAQEPAFDYLRRRGISPATAVAAGLGFVGDYERASKITLGGFPLADLQTTGLFNAKGNFRLFRHQLLVCYWAAGEVVSLQARNIGWRDKDDGPKELTLGPVVIPFHADALLEPQETVYVCEGAIDTLSLLELGLVAVGIPGAKNFKPDWCELFDDVGEVVLALDNDPAGDAGAAQIADHFRRAGRAVQRLHLPAGIKDVNEFLTSQAG